MTEDKSKITEIRTGSRDGGDRAAADEKKVEYLELIYDLIFVYIIGRNNSLLRNVEGGFITGSTVLIYVFCTLAVIQIWNFSTYYINVHGRNGVRDHIALLVNMYLLYYIGEGIGPYWSSYQKKFHFAWALILINLGIQYAIELRNHRGRPLEERSIKHRMIVLFGEAALVLAVLPVYERTGIFLAGAPILYGIVMTRLFSDENKAELVDFPHLSERAMLYVVFTFGEMIIAIASYFDEEFTANSVYFSGMCFLIVVGLFLCYEVLYDRIIDREMKTTGINYMIIHIFLIFAMNNITASLEFMRDESVLLWPKILFLISSILLYFFCLFALQLYAKQELKLCQRFLGPVVLTTVLFVAAMILLRENMKLNILVSVLYVFAVFLEIWRFSRQKG